MKNGIQVKDQGPSQISDSQYVKFLEKRVNETTAESKRYLEKYADLRVFAYNQIESLLRKH